MMLISGQVAVEAFNFAQGAVLTVLISMQPSRLLFQTDEACARASLSDACRGMFVAFWIAGIP